MKIVIMGTSGSRFAIPRLKTRSESRRKVRRKRTGAASRKAKIKIKKARGGLRRTQLHDSQKCASCHQNTLDIYRTTKVNFGNVTNTVVNNVDNDYSNR